MGSKIGKANFISQLTEVEEICFIKLLKKGP